MKKTNSIKIITKSKTLLGLANRTRISMKNKRKVQM